MGQAAVLHSPRDLMVILLVDPAAAPAEPDWGWLRWLPHVAPYDGQDCTGLIGDGTESLSARVLELTALVKHVPGRPSTYGLSSRRAACATCWWCSMEPVGCGT